MSQPQDLTAHLTALLFVSAEPLTLRAAAAALQVSELEVENAARRLAESPPAGLMLQRHNGAIQLATAPSAAPYVRRLMGTPEVQRLSKAALEVLALVAYRQPITRSEIDAVRGVSSDRAVATLVARGLIEEVGRREGVGRATLLGTSVGFLEYLGIGSLDDLPRLEELGGQMGQPLAEGSPTSSG
jgi:segregation and condensation protein B